MDIINAIRSGASEFRYRQFCTTKLSIFKIVLEHEDVKMSDIINEVDYEPDPEDFYNRKFSDEYESYESFLDAVFGEELTNPNLDRNDPSEVSYQIKYSDLCFDLWNEYKDEKWAEANRNNHPIYGEVFEWQDPCVPREWIEAAKKVGLGTMNAVKDKFNESVFINEPFPRNIFNEYWIPLYLSCNPNAMALAKKWKKENPDKSWPRNWAVYDVVSRNFHHSDIEILNDLWIAHS